MFRHVSRRGNDCYVNILLVGDSNTGTEAKDPRKIPLAVSKALPPYHCVIPAGVSGATAADVCRKKCYMHTHTYKRKVAPLGDIGKGFVVVGLGTNDLTSGVEPKNYEAGLRRLIEALRNQFPECTILVLIPLHPDSEKVKPFVTASKAVVSGSAAKFVETPLSNCDFREDDPVHLNSDGASKVGQALAYEIMQASGYASVLKLNQFQNLQFHAVKKMEENYEDQAIEIPGRIEGDYEVAEGDS
jgi:lysophospholipase L1-like esterase